MSHSSTLQRRFRFLFVSTIFFVFSTPVLAQEGFAPPQIPSEEFYRAEVTALVKETTQELYEGYVETTQEVRAKILNGVKKGKVVTAINGGIVSIDAIQKVKVGDVVMLVKTYKADGGFEYAVSDHARLQPLGIILAIFFVMVIFFGRWKGVGALFGLAFSIFILVKWIVPQIIGGKDPLMITLMGALGIAGVSLFLAHGFHRRTLLALFSTIITLALALGISAWFVDFAHLFGKGSEEAYFLQSSNLGQVNLRGLLLAGIVIGTLGVLDDITTAQTAVVGELRQANPALSPRELYRRALVVGREHIASLVNTLVLAYAGAALPLFLLFSLNEGVPLWFKLNSEVIAEELIRTLIGSLALILAVPIATAAAAFFLQKEKIKNAIPVSRSDHR